MPALDPGSVTIDPATGAHSGSGFALDEFNALFQVVEDAFAAGNQSLPTGVALAALKQGCATQATSAARVVAYIHDNAETDGDNQGLL